MGEGVKGDLFSSRLSPLKGLEPASVCAGLEESESTGRHRDMRRRAPLAFGQRRGIFSRRFASLVDGLLFSHLRGEYKQDGCWRRRNIARLPFKSSSRRTETAGGSVV